MVSVIPLSMLPGATATARMPRLPYSIAMVCVNASIPPLLAAYAAMYGWPNDADVELKFTITPSP